MCRYLQNFQPKAQRSFDHEPSLPVLSKGQRENTAAMCVATRKNTARDRTRILGENWRMPPAAKSNPKDSALPFDSRAVLDVTMDALIVHDAEGRVLYVNQCACAMYGYEQDQFFSLRPEDLTENRPPYAAANADEHRRSALHKGVEEFLWHSRRKNGELFWSEVSLRRHSEDGATIIIAIIRDISERKRIEDALRESEEKLSKIFHGSSNAIVLAELESGRIVDVNKTWIAACGISREAALGKTGVELGVWTDLVKLDAFQRDLKESGHARQREVLLSMAHGPQPTLVSAEAVTLSGGRYTLWELHDVSALRRSEAATREREERLRMISENFDSGMFYQVVTTKDRGPRFTYVSDSVRRLYGATPEEILADPSLVFGRHHPEDSKRMREEEAAAFNNLTTFRTQFRATDPSGQMRWSSVVATPRSQPDGSVIWDGIEFIITDLKRAEEERASLERQLQHAQRMESVGRLAGGVAHDFNNMLGVVLGQLELAKADLPPSHPIQSNLDDIEKAAQRSKELTQQLLAFARKQAVVPRVLDLNEVVTNSLKILQRLIREDIRLVWRPVRELWALKMDASQLDQILTNLCVNARDAIAGAGSVTIDAGNETLAGSTVPGHPELPAGDYVRLTVADDGCGMDQEILGHIFEPFFTTKGVGVGTGLGLSTVYGIVRQNGGAILVKSEPGRGTSFVIYLPRYRGPEVARRESKTEHESRTGTETILLVEDEPSLLGMLSVLLRRSGYNVLPAPNAQAAIELATQNPAAIRLLISDVIMPGMNGRELARRIEEIVPNVPILLMSGYTADILDWKHQAGKRVSFLQKPFVASELMKMVREVLDSSVANLRTAER
jgi:two-component system, cell cycle sensor histidine kinase and response regulator CckA